MGRASAGTTHGLQCPDCATGLELAPAGSNGVLRLFCPGCGGRFRGALPSKANDRTPPEVTPLGPITVGPLALRWRALVLTILEQLYLVGHQRRLDASACPRRIYSGRPGLAD